MSEYNRVEQEVIILNAICGFIDEMVNFAMFRKPETFSNIGLLFSTSESAQLFNILLCDFLSLPQPRRKGSLPFGLPTVPAKVRNSEQSHLYYLRRICNEPHLGSDTKNLLVAVENFSNWLEGETVLEKVWFSSIELELDMRVVRFDALKITGNLLKHNFTRLEADTKKIQRILKANGHQRTVEECYLILSEFKEWFHDHAFNYQSSEIAGLFNEIRWAIHVYLQSEFSRAHDPYFDDSLNIMRYSYNIPKSICKPLAKAMYWDLMNLVRSKPIVPRFSVSQSFKTGLR
ncbi:MAG: hypothetical protein OXG62_16950 [Nitrospinae bacterium]|nr:hypothetical protein [Nitrospinota bacterium]